MSARLAVLVTVLGALSAQAASEWDKSYPPDVICPLVPPGARTYLIAAAGQPVAEVKAAAEALSNAVRTCRRVTMVNDDASLGDLSKVSDQDLVTRAKSVPIDIIVVVRVAQGAPGAPPVSVISMMNRQGEPRGGFTAPKGSPPLPPEPPKEEAPPPPKPKPTPRVEEPPPPMLEEATPAPPPTPKKVEPEAPPPPPPDPKELYAQRSMHFLNDPRNERTDGDPAQVVMGGATRPMPGTAFYNAVGRHDLANSYSSRSTGKVLAALGGLVLLAGAGAGAYFSLNSRCVRGEFSAGSSLPDTCLQHEIPDWTLYAEGGAGALGLGLFLWGVIASPHPIDGSEARRLVDEYNAKLRKELGLTTTGEVEREDRVKVALVPSAGPGGLGLFLVGQF